MVEGAKRWNFTTTRGVVGNVIVVGIVVVGIVLRPLGNIY